MPAGGRVFGADHRSGRGAVRGAADIAATGGAADGGVYAQIQRRAGTADGAADAGADVFGHPAGNGGATAHPPRQRQRRAGRGQRHHADLRPRQHHRPHRRGDVGEHGNHVLHRGGILRRRRDPPHPPHHSGGAGGGHRRLSGGGVDGAVDVLMQKNNADRFETISYEKII